MLNSKAPPSKQSNVMFKMNKMLYTVFGFLAFICIAFSICYMVFNATHDGLEYCDVDDESGSVWAFIEQVLIFLVAYSNLIPISLYVTMEILKLVIAALIGSDIDMYYEEEDRPSAVKTSDLIEELG